MKMNLKNVNLKKLSRIALGCTGFLGFPIIALANDVLITVEQPMKVSYRIAQKNENSEPVYGAIHTVNLNKELNVPVPLDKYDKTGVMITSVNGHELPPSANEFDKPERCSMTTNKTKTTGSLQLSATKHTLNCKTYGGVYG